MKRRRARSAPMAMKKALLGVGVVLIAAVVWLASADREGTTPAESRPRLATPSEGTSATSKVDAAVEDRARSGAAASERAALTASGPVAVEGTTIRGRCVDAATGAPLSDCAVTLTGQPPNQQRLEEYEHSHGPVVWSNPEPVTTVGDGHFAFTFEPPPSHAFQLRIDRVAFVKLEANWYSLEPDESSTWATCRWRPARWFAGWSRIPVGPQRQTLASGSTTWRMGAG